MYVFESIIRKVSGGRRYISMVERVKTVMEVINILLTVYTLQILHIVNNIILDT